MSIFTSAGVVRWGSDPILDAIDRVLGRSGGRPLRPLAGGDGSAAAVPPRRTGPLGPSNVLQWLERQPAGRPVVLGYASVWSQVYLRGQRMEQMRRGAFAACLRRRRPIDALIRHDTRLRLGATAEGNLYLAEDDHGLFVALCPRPARDFGLVDLVACGEICSMSIAIVSEKVQGGTRMTVSGRPGSFPGWTPCTVTDVLIDEVSFCPEGSVNPATCCVLLDGGRVVVPLGRRCRGPKADALEALAVKGRYLARWR